MKLNIVLLTFIIIIINSNYCEARCTFPNAYAFCPAGKNWTVEHIGHGGVETLNLPGASKQLDLNCFGGQTYDELDGCGWVKYDVQVKANDVQETFNVNVNVSDQTFIASDYTTWSIVFSNRNGWWNGDFSLAVDWSMQEINLTKDHNYYSCCQACNHWCYAAVISNAYFYYNKIKQFECFPRECIVASYANNGTNCCNQVFNDCFYKKKLNCNACDKRGANGMSEIVDIMQQVIPAQSFTGLNRAITVDEILNALKRSRPIFVIIVWSQGERAKMISQPDRYFKELEYFPNSHIISIYGVEGYKYCPPNECPNGPKPKFYVADPDKYPFASLTYDEILTYSSSGSVGKWQQTIY